MITMVEDGRKKIYIIQGHLSQGYKRQVKKQA